ncbi:PucR family transcriptional regulator (plasmid) [Streptomyces sp. BI20]|uniref:PucR family transcriptional regulator n=1 Tax=Streptomyces sp. BI20 TaxID=3403460 RepID=UPI003C71B915
MHPAAALLPHVPRMAAAMARRIAELPAYRALPSAVRDHDLVVNTEAVLRLFLTTAAEGRPATDAELAGPISWGAERARDEVPLATVLAVYPLAARAAWQAVADDPASAGPVDPGALTEALLDFLGRVLPAVASAHLREQHELRRGHDEARRALTEALLTGRPARSLAERHGLALAERHDVVALHLPAPVPPATATSLSRALRGALAEHSEVPAGLTDTGAVLLVPLPHPGGASTDGGGGPGPAEPIPERLSRALGIPLYAAAHRADSHGEIPAARAEAVELLELARRLRPPNRLHRLVDLAVERQLTRPGPARTALRALLDPLLPHPHLLDALRAYLAFAHDRGAAAGALSIHRNTLTYRLDRIRVLTGRDPRDPTEVVPLAAALTVVDGGGPAD